jgi:UbiD family decarboxylase
LDLRRAIHTLRDSVQYIDDPVSETDPMIRKKGLSTTPVIFNSVNGKKIAANFISTRDLLCHYLGIQKTSLAKHLAGITPDPKYKIIQDLPDKMISSKANLDKLPILKYFDGDGGHYITGGVVIAEENGMINMSIHRIMKISKEEGAIRLVPPRHLYTMHQKALEKGEPLPITVAIGVHPLVLFGVSVRTPTGGEMAYINAITGGITYYKSNNGLPVPPAEIILEGYITGETVDEGPFVDITGTYDKVRKEPVITFTEMHVKEDFIYYSISPASPEHQVLMGVPFEPVIYGEVAKVCEVRNVIMTEGSRHYLHAVVQIKKRTEGDGKNAILAAFTGHPSLKHVIVVDDDIDIFDIRDVEYALATRFRGDRDLLLINNVRGSSLDPTISEDGTVTKLGLDATAELSNLKKFKRVV